MIARRQPLIEAEWRMSVTSHERRVERWANDRRLRAGLGVKHPVYDFLFTYYSFRPSQLMRWSPGFGIVIEGATRSSFAGAQEFVECEEGITLPADHFPKHRRPYLTWALEYLKRVARRPPHLSCFGLHEWAMVYGITERRHDTVPLRLSGPEIKRCCESLGLCCTHYDAYRFFTNQARPLNAAQLRRDSTIENDQPGCIHATMDLYKFAYKIAPFSSSDLIASCFELALSAREIDMRASPYDLSAYGFKPILVEDASGRAEYAAYQEQLYENSRPLRARLIGEYQALRDAQSDDSFGTQHNLELS